MQLLDLGIERGFENFDRLARHRAETRDAVQHRRVQIFDDEGTYIKEWAFKGLPCGLHLHNDQQMYQASGFAGEILRLDENGKALGRTGQPGKGLGEFGEAHYMTMAPNGDIWVADTVRPALHRFVKK